MTTYNNWQNNLPGVSAGIIAQSVGAAIPGAVLQANSTINPNWNIATSKTALVIKNSDGTSVLSFQDDGVIETAAGSIKADEWIQIVNLMKQFIMDVANDEETAKKYPYLKDAAHIWLMNDLRK